MTFRFRAPSPLPVLAVALSSLLSACATVSPETAHPADPYEGFNRTMFAVNQKLDLVLKPVAQGYVNGVPLPMRASIGNFFGNVADPMIGVNNLAQGKPREAGNDWARVAINSTLGIFGLFDVASEMGFDKHNEDIGQTLAVWGVKPGPYFYWPVLGPRTLRDTAGYVADSQFDPVWQIQDKPTLYSTAGTRIVDIRAALLPADTILESAALDKYSYIRNAYLQRRLSQVYDGEPPREPDAESADTPQNAPDSAPPTP
jgi:phospholipid-binding lipoprotein MlaA